ncbi:DUF4870 domain-containing protein [Psychromicrobium lacuslunae]|uniref:DUF4870 domain-containing protein n=1 Tax=Psychromicrobium lacuslunae TaxID=1618207 RepID=UPI0005D41093
MFPGGDEDAQQQAERHTQQFESAPARALPLTATEDQQFAFLAHCGGILGFFPSLIIYLIFKDRGPFTAQESKEALNFTLPPTVLAIILNILAISIPVVGSVFAILAAVIWATLTVFSVIAAIHVNRGNPYRYPMNLRLIR